MSNFKCKNGFYLILKNNNRYEFTRIKNKSKIRKASIDLKQTDNSIKKLNKKLVINLTKLNLFVKCISQK